MSFVSGIITGLLAGILIVLLDIASTLKGKNEREGCGVAR